MHKVYLPFTEADLQKCYAPDAAAPDGRHLHYFTKSLQRLSEYESALDAQIPSLTPTHLARQLEKDERFWVVTALMSLFHQPEDARTQAFADLFGRTNLPVPSGHPSWNSHARRLGRLFGREALVDRPRWRTHIRDLGVYRFPFHHATYGDDLPRPLLSGYVNCPKT